jgi:hypothetical protein
MEAGALAVMGLVGSVASAGIGAFGQMQAAGSQAAASNYNAAVARNNQIVAQQEADRAAAVGATRAQNQDFQNRARMGMIEAAQGASGIDINSPSSTEVRRSAATLGRFDTQTVMDNALAEVRSNVAKATTFGEQATLDTAQARNANSAGLIGAAGSILGGASSFADKWIRYRNVGTFAGGNY